MANLEHLKMLSRGVKEWNNWREKNPDILIDLRRSNLEGMDLSDYNLDLANLEEANLSGAILNKAEMWTANLTKAVLRDAILIDTYLEMANLYGADLTGANLTVAWLRGTNLHRTNFANANLFRADLQGADIVRTNFEGANLSEAKIFGISAWEVNLEGANQTDLRITDKDQDVPILTVDDLEVAQFIYLLLHNEKIRNVIDTVTSKTVLILGRFTKRRKNVLDSIKISLRNKGYVPILFDFNPSQHRDLTETVQLLANMSKMVIVDLTDAKSIPQELSSIIPHLPSVPIQPILLIKQKPYAMFEHWTNFDWVLDEFYYENKKHLLENFEEHVLKPAENWKTGKEEKTALQQENLLLRKEIEKLKKRIPDKE